MAYAEDIYERALGRRVELVMGGVGGALVTGTLVEIDGDTLWIHELGSAFHGCQPGDVCLTECEATEVCAAKIDGPV